MLEKSAVSILCTTQGGPVKRKTNSKSTEKTLVTFFLCSIDSPPFLPTRCIGTKILDEKTPPATYRKQLPTRSWTYFRSAANHLTIIYHQKPTTTQHAYSSHAQVPPNNV